VKLLEHRIAKRFALWVKESARALNVLAGVFFVLTFIAGLAWILGANIEPVAFVLSLCASSFFGLPHLAEFILPSRKPIREMTHEELLDFVRASNPSADWKGINRSWVSEVFLREDPRLRFRAKFTEDGVQNDDFKEKWANCHPDPRATGYWYDLYYDGNLIERFLLVSVDGGRATLPAPDWQGGKVNAMNYRVAQIHDSLGTLDQYIQRSGLEIETGA
jgi:hypothetical protein